MNMAITKPLTQARDLSRRETGDEYVKVLFRRGRFRVVICRDGIQWLFQRRRTHVRPGGTAWDTLGYCTSRKALMRLSRSNFGKSWPELSSLPERFKQGDWS